MKKDQAASSGHAPSRNTASPRWAWGMLFALAIMLVAGGTLAATSNDQSLGTIQCNVPSASYPTIQSAHDDNCDEVLLVSGDYLEFLTITDDLSIVGPSDFSARIVGKVTVDTTQPVSFRFVTLVAGDDPNSIFSDGFETGDASAWS